MRMFEVLVLLSSGCLALLVQAADPTQMQGGAMYNIKTMWNGAPVDGHPTYNITLFPSKDGILPVMIAAPYFNDPLPEQKPGELQQIFSYEDVEIFFLGANDNYFQVGVGPHGHYEVYLFRKYRDLIKGNLTLKYSAKVDDTGKVWIGQIQIPLEYLPMNVMKMNMYAQHGVDQKRQYESLYPQATTDTTPDFHKLNYFQPIDISKLIPNYQTDLQSSIWKDALSQVAAAEGQKTAGVSRIETSGLFIMGLILVMTKFMM